MRIPIYVPAPDATLPYIASGSAIVGNMESALGRIRIDYEGNIFNFQNLRHYADRVRHAADRHVNNYPTVARAWVMLNQLRIVGEYDTDSHKVWVNDLDADKLAVWLGITRDELALELM